MKIRALAFLIFIGVIGFAGAFIWTALRPTTPDTAASDATTPTASVSEVTSDGRLNMQVYMLGELAVRLEIQFAADAGAEASAGMRPDVSFAMLDMHMDGFDPPLELIGQGVWRVRLKLPMAGRWVVSAGFGEERAEVEFDAN